MNKTIDVYNFRRQIEYNLLKKYLEQTKKQILLDVACGDGEITKKFKDNFKLIIGIDLNKNQIEKAKENNFNKNVIFRKENAENLPFRNETIDVIISNCALEHFKNDEKALNEMQRVLKKQGELILTAECKPKRFSQKFHKKREKEVPIYNYYTLESLQKKLFLMKITNFQYYLSGIGLTLWYVLTRIGAFVNYTHLAGLLYYFNPAVGGFLHKLFLPVFVKIGEFENGNEINSGGIIIKAIKTKAAFL